MSTMRPCYWWRHLQLNILISLLHLSLLWFNFVSPFDDHFSAVHTRYFICLIQNYISFVYKVCLITTAISYVIIRKLSSPGNSHFDDTIGHEVSSSQRYEDCFIEPIGTIPSCSHWQAFKSSFLTNNNGNRTLDTGWIRSALLKWLSTASEPQTSSSDILFFDCSWLANCLFRDGGAYVV
jgi:hypothetical protein